jgi:hypothetical protein
LSDSSEFRSASSVHGYQNPQRSVTPSWCEASKTFNLKSNKLLQMHHIHIYIHNIYKGTHTDIHIRQNNAGKTASVYIKNGKMPVFYNGVPELSLALLYSTLLIYSK